MPDDLSETTDVTGAKIGEREEKVSSQGPTFSGQNFPKLILCKVGTS